MITQIITAHQLQLGDVILWEGQHRLVEGIDKIFCGSIEVKLHNLFLPRYWSPKQQLIKFVDLSLDNKLIIDNDT